MKFHLSMPHDEASNIFIWNGLRQIQEEYSLPLELSFTDHRNESIQRVVDKINKIKPDICLFLYLNDLESFIDYVDCPVKCGWIFDVTFKGIEIPESNLIEAINKLDYFFTVCPSHAKKLNGYWVPEGCDPYSHFPVYTGDKYGYTFVGQVVENSKDYENAGFVHLDRIGWLQALEKKFGSLITQFGHAYGNVGLRCISNYPLKGAWANNIVSTNSIINLGNNGWPHMKYCWSARDYRIMAAKGFLLTNRTEGIEDFFVDGQDLVIYEGVEECIDKINFYANKKELRDKIAISGMNKVLSSFTFARSLEKMLAHMEIL